MPEAIYLDYNATTPVDKEVADAFLPYLTEGYGNPSSSYFLGIRAKAAIANARKQVADLINANPDEIIFTSGGTESNNYAIQGIAFANREKGKHIITSEIEHPSVINVCKHLETLGWEVSYIPVDKSATVNPLDIQCAIRKDTTLISIMHANNEVGSIQPISEIAKIAEKYAITFHTDAAQSLGKVECNVKNLGVNSLTIAGHKMYAPKGIGALYVKRGTGIKKILFGAGQEFGLRPGTENVPYIIALGKACEIAKRDFALNVQTMLSAKNNLIRGLQKKINNVSVNGNPVNCLPNTLSISIHDVNALDLSSVLQDTVLFSMGSACHSGETEISPVLKAMRVDPLLAANTIRLSTGKHTSEQEIKRAIEVIVKAIQKLGKASIR